VDGLPRRPGLELVRSLFRAGGAVRAGRRILERRRPDVVLGAGSYVAGPIVLAAASMRIPAALTEADAHLGLANRLAAPFAKRVFLSYELDGLGPPKLSSGAIRAGRGRFPGEAVRFGPPDGRTSAVPGAGAKSPNSRGDTWEGPVVLHFRRAGLRRCGRVERATTTSCRRPTTSAPRFRGRPRALPSAGRCGSLRRLARRPCSSYHIPATDEERTLRDGGGAVVVPAARSGRAQLIA
jgi:hypothetical protein